MAWTETKRRSVQRYAGVGVLPVADGTIAVGDRAHVASLFSADSYPEPAAPPEVQGNSIKQISKRAFGHRAFEYWRVARGPLFARMAT